MTKNKKVTYIVLLDVTNTDRVEHAEMISNNHYSVVFPSGCETGAGFELSKLILDELGLKDGINAIPIDDYTNMVNNDELDMGDFWTTYVTLDIKTQKEIDSENKEYIDFVSELDALCLSWGYPQMTHEQKQEAFECYLDMQNQDPMGAHVWIEDALYSIYNKSDKMDLIGYLGGRYLKRTFRVRLPEFEEEMDITIAVESLQTALRNTKQLEGVIDSTIYYYVDDSLIHLRPEIICAEHLDCPIEFISELR